MKKLYFLLLLCLLLSAEMIAQITPHIVGGDDTDIDEVPWQVLIETNTPSNGILDACGGTIIAPNWILTACHCTFDPANHTPLNPNQIRIYAGITLRSQKNNGQIRNVVEIIRHPDYGTNPNSEYNHDIALLRLSSPLTLNNDVQVIDYATQADADAGWIDPGQLATVSGWGTLSFQGIQPDHLQSVDIPIVDNATAAGQYNPLPQNLDITANMLAAGNVGTGGQDACQGDSGGPLIVQDASDRDILAGIVSFGIDCADPNFLGIYTRVSRYCGWIAENIAAINGPDSFCGTETYAIDNIPASTTVNWTASGNISVPQNSTGSSVTVTSNGNGDGELIASLTASCGNATLTKTIKTGTPVITAETYSYNGSPDYSISPYYSVPNNPVTQVPAYVIAEFSFDGATSSGIQILDQSDPSITWGSSSGPESLSFYFDFYGNIDPQQPADQWVIFRITAESSCGSSNYDVAFYWQNPNAYMVYPNPADTEITVASMHLMEGTGKTGLNPSKEKPKAFEVLLTDFNGNIVISKESKEAEKQLRLNTQNIPEGIYFLQINDENTTIAKKIIISH